MGNATRHIDILGEHKLDAAHQDITAGGMRLRRDGEGLHSALVLYPVFVHLRQDNRHGHPFAGADVFHGDIQL